MFDAPAAIFPETNALIVSDPFSAAKMNKKLLAQVPNRKKRVNHFEKSGPCGTI
jgi:hypothetical protein